MYSLGWRTRNRIRSARSARAAGLLSTTVCRSAPLRDQDACWFSSTAVTVTRACCVCSEDREQET
eukprot:4353210-Alexandrium_andersonii.AAC.1